MTRRIVVVTESRATYGYVRPILRILKEDPDVDLQVVVTGMHLSKEHGLTLREVEADGFPIAAKAHLMVVGDTSTAWAKGLGLGIINLAQAYDQLQPDLILVAGDRGEIMAATTAAAYMHIPVAHIQSGDLSGHIDGSARHAITKLAHIHLPACEDSAQRVLKMGEEEWRVHNVGAPQLDEMVREPVPTRDELEEHLGIKLGDPTLLVVQHPVLIEEDQAHDQMIETMEAIKRLGHEAIVIYPNNDSGGQDIIRAIQAYEDLPHVHTFDNLERRYYIGLMKHCDVLVGNSSSGLLEAPTFQLPAIDIGNRQQDRMRAENVLQAPHDAETIAERVTFALEDEGFRETLAKVVNPYGDGQSAERIVKVLKEVELGHGLLDKRMTY